MALYASCSLPQRASGLKSELRRRKFLFFQHNNEWEATHP